MSSLFDLAWKYVFSGVPSNAVWDLIKFGWSKSQQKSWEQLYLESFKQSVNEAMSFLAKYVGSGGEIALPDQALSDALRRDLRVDPATLSFTTSSDEEFAARLAKAMVANSVLVIGGNNLSEDDYAQLVRNLVQHARSNFRASVLKNETAFRRAVLTAALNMDADMGNVQSILGETREYLAKEFGLAMALLSEIRDGVEEVRADVKDIKTYIEAQTEHMPTALHSIPAPPGDFTGRATEVQKVIAELTSPTSIGAAISGLAGMGGVGKTALALVAAQKVMDAYPDAQIIVNMQGTSKTPLAPADAMAQVIRKFLGAEVKLPDAPKEVEAIYRNVLFAKRALILLDNAKDSTQVEDLLPPPTCALLVTSRHYFVVPGLTPLRLDVLKEGDARNLLLRLCARINGLADEVAGLCGYLPLALRIAGSAIAERIDLSPVEYVTRLKEKRLKILKGKPGDPQDDVEAAFELSYEQLTEESREKWRMLAVFPTPFDWLAGAVVWGLTKQKEHHIEVDEDKAKDALGEMVRYSIVEYDAPSPLTSTSLRASTSAAKDAASAQHAQGRSVSALEGGEDGRYRLHELLAEFARGKWSEEEKRTAERRHAEH